MQAIGRLECLSKDDIDCIKGFLGCKELVDWLKDNFQGILIHVKLLLRHPSLGKVLKIIWQEYGDDGYIIGNIVIPRSLNISGN